MAKESGLGLTVTVDDVGGTARAISNDVTSCSFSIPSAVQDITGVNVSAFERLLLLADLTLTLNGVFNDAASTGQYTVLFAIRSLFAGEVGRTTAIAVSGQTLSDEVLYTELAYTRAMTGELTWSAPAMLSDGGVPAWA